MSQGSTTPVSRRTVAKGAAWAAPVILGGAAAPAYASSPPPVAPELDPQAFCKHPGEPKRYHVGVIWQNTLPCETTVTITAIQLTPNASGEPPVTFPGSTTFSVSANSTTTQVYDSNLTEASSNGTVTVQYTYTDCSGTVVTETASLSAASLPPCQQLGISDYPH